MSVGRNDHKYTKPHAHSLILAHVQVFLLLLSLLAIPATRIGLEPPQPLLPGSLSHLPPPTLILELPYSVFKVAHQRLQTALRRSSFLRNMPQTRRDGGENVDCVRREWGRIGGCNLEDSRGSSLGRY
ncbi:hypothetical protein L198_07733 [Cryptococcus wingfieldii CBS 7118]|uniref:Uncharacterized protein n=1 Tax=Cryptococcus wingfieldii CBS 7118 TaxID=1295528 RepID=A0A1E3I140_9TREE|nr:hypothetical protein L198_07733 [Cryptococcus wingfieldii CBS 7118]ODN82313.1 hypothetical protein L198_07733 [Cryptococcus wingfieldii CBS 7118]